MAQVSPQNDDRAYDRPPDPAPVVVLHEDSPRFLDEIALVRGVIEHPLILVDCGVQSEDFEHPGLDVTWRAVRECFAATQSCDPHTLVLTLTRVLVEVQYEREKELGPQEAASRAVDEKTWPRQVVMALLAAPAPPPIDILRSVVPNLLARRKLKGWSKDTAVLQGRVIEKISLGGVSFGGIAEEVATHAEQYRQSLKSSNGRTALAILEEIANTPSAELIPTGIPQIDASTHGGLYPGLWLHGGGTGDGKSYTTLYCSKRRAAMSMHTLTIGCEDPEELWLARLLADYGPTPMDPGLILAEFKRNKRKILTPFVSEEWMTQARDAFREHAQFIHYIDARNDPRPSRIAQDIRYHRVVHGCDLIFVDYIQATKAEDPKMAGAANKTQAIGHAVEIIKEATLGVNAVTCLLSQYAREEYKGGKEPTLSALKHCGELENMAECATLMWRDEEKMLRVKVAKLKVANVDEFRYIIRRQPETGAHLGWELDTGPVGRPEPEPRRAPRQSTRSPRARATQ